MSESPWISIDHNKPPRMEKVFIKAWITTRNESFWWAASGYLALNGCWASCECKNCIKNQVYLSGHNKGLNVRYWMPIPKLPEGE